MGFAEVFCEVEQAFLSPRLNDEFPVALADRAGVVRLPEQGLVRGAFGFALEVGKQVYAVQIGTSGDFHAFGGAEGGVQIQRA